MSGVRVCSLASGSNGNAYYLESGSTRLLVDAGVSFRRLKARADARRLDLSRVEAIFVSHEHSDHVYGLATLSRRADARVYMTQGTWQGMRPKYQPQTSATQLFKPGDTITRGDFAVHTFGKPHDVFEPCSFRFEANGVSIGVFTDIGAPCPELAEQLALCHLAFFESNYDEAMLWAGSYTPQLKRRITGGRGHLSNAQAATIVAQLPDDAPLHTLLLAHLSGENNTPDLALDAFHRKGLDSHLRIEALSRDQPSPVFLVDELQATTLTE